ncbi:MAG: hypothetical protein GC160_08820 [Acidobacteria bacterium]|nr:hypothetical protein [Acidobacteriota bacterium]
MPNTTCNASAYTLLSIPRLRKNSQNFRVCTVLSVLRRRLVNQTLRLIHCAALLLVWGLSPLGAQEFRATLQGSVGDQSDARIPGASVELTNTKTGVVQTTTTNESGLYSFQFLPPGLYRLSVTAEGFKTDVVDNIDLSLGQNQRIDINLELGQVTETVEVTSEVSLIQTDEASTGAVIRSEIKDNLPLKGRSSLFMFNLAPGVVTNRFGEDTRPNDTITNVLFSANGSPVASGDVAVDGTINTVNVNRDVNISQWVPSVDAVGEFKLQTGILPAEFGRTGGSFMNIVIKSGTNEVHGSFYEYFKNSALDANNFFARGQGQPLPAFGASTFGATVGAPIIKNRTFGFFSYEGAREGNGLNRRASVPTPLMRAGDFSEVNRPLYDPFSVQMVNGAPTRTRFANNVIPSSRIDPVGLNAVTYFPDQNTAPADPTQPWVNNFTFSDKWPRNYDAFIGKGDHKFSDNWNMFVRVNRGTGTLIFPHQFDGIASPGRNVVDRPHFGASIGNTILLNPRTTFDVRLGYTWGTENRLPYSDGFDLTSLGFSQQFAGMVQRAAFPQMSFSGFQGLSTTDWQSNPGNTWTLQPSVSMMRGAHLIKIGGDARLIYGNFFSNQQPSGAFSFNNAWTDGPRADQPATGSGFPIASLMVGLGSGTITQATGLSILNKYFSGYVQDDWKVTNKLTVNLGLRYEYETPRTERFDRATRGFCFSCESPINALVPGMNLRGGLTFAGQDGNPRGIYNPDKNNWSPRIGLAYRILPKTVLRAGYGLYYIPIIGSVESPGFDAQTPWVTSTDGITPLNTLSNPFPDGHLPITGSSNGLGTLLGQNIRFVEPSDRTPSFHTWTFNIQQALPGQSVFEIGYTGSRGIHLATDQAETGYSENINQLPADLLSLGSALNEQVANPFYGVITTGALSGATVQRKQLLRPYPQFQNIIRDNPAFGNSVYHSLQMKYQKRMTDGLTALISYTFSKNIGDISPAQNNYNRQAERAVAEFNVPQRLTVTFAYQLPFGKGAKFLNDIHPVADKVIGGWQISMFNTYQSGFPLTFGVQRPNIFGVGEGSQRPDAVGDPSSGVEGVAHVDRLNRYFNIQAFAQPADFHFGNLASRVGSIRGPGMNNWNFTLSKKFSVKERVQFELRAASYNLLNKPVFGNPNTTFGAGAFGTIGSQANLPRQSELMLRITY